MSKEMLFPKKITVKTMGMGTRQLEQVAEASAPKAVPVLRVWGIVQDCQAQVSNFGPYKKFRGEFGAVNLITGEEARSQMALLPAIAETIVSSIFDRAAKDGGSAQIALEITVTFNESPKGGTKFAYGAKPLMEFKDDALSIMAKSLPAVNLVKALSAPNNKK